MEKKEIPYKNLQSNIKLTFYKMSEKVTMTETFYSGQQTYTLLCKSDVERADWKEAIISLLNQNQGETIFL